MTNYKEHQNKRQAALRDAIRALEPKMGNALQPAAPPLPSSAQQQQPLTDTQLMHKPFNVAELRLCLADALY